MLTRRLLARRGHRLNARLERFFPEKRLFLKSDQGTRFLHLSPAIQFLAVAVGFFGLVWTVAATALVMMQSIGAGSARQQTMAQSHVFEERLTQSALDKDQYRQEATEAETRFNLALAQVSSMQESLLTSERRRQELESEIATIQAALQRSNKARDELRKEAETLALSRQEPGNAPETGRAHDSTAAIAYLTDSLDRTARERDESAADAAAARAELQVLEDEMRLAELRNDAIFAQLEDAISVSVEPLDKIFKATGLNSGKLLSTIRKRSSGQGGPLVPITVSTMGGAHSAEEVQANRILDRMREFDLYRIAAEELPLVHPVKARVRNTSSFGGRNDPFGAGRRHHAGQDFAAPSGTAAYSTAAGTVIFAGRQSGYGQLVKVRHAFGVETRYAHLSKIRVTVGQKVSRGDQIGDIGSTGRSTGSHLHYEVLIDGTAVNPMNFIKAGRNVF